MLKGILSIYLKIDIAYSENLRNMKLLFDLIGVLQDITISDSKILNLQKQLNDIRQANYYQIDNNFLREIVCIDFGQPLITQMKQITIQWEALANIIQETIKFGNEQMNQNQLQYLENLQNYKYEISEIDQAGEQNLYASAISNDLKFIVSGGDDQLYKVWDNSNYKLILKNKVDSCISYVKFTDESKFCYVGVNSGTLFQLDVQNNFIQAYKQKIHKKNILNLYCITNTILLTSSADKTIIKTDLSNKQQLFLINAQDGWIFGLDYHRQRDIIVSCSDNSYISFWHKKADLLMINNQYQTKKVLFITNNDQLLSLYAQSVFIWQINFENKEMVVIRNLANNIQLNNISLVQNQSIKLRVYLDLHYFRSQSKNDCTWHQRVLYIFQSYHIISNPQCIVF